MTAPMTAQTLWATFERLLEDQRQALVAGDVAAVEQSSAALRVLLADPSWRSAVKPQASIAQLRALQARLDINAQAAARAQASTRRALTCVTRGPAVYTVGGNLTPPRASQRRTTA